jgi:hypothetical protein
VSAPEHDDVAAFVENGPYVLLYERSRLVRCEISLFDLIGETRTGLNDELDVASVVRQQLAHIRARQRACRCEHADYSRARARGGGLHGRLDCHDRHGDACAKRLHGHGRCGVARDDDRLCTFRDQEFRNRDSALPDERFGAIAIRSTGRITDVQKVFTGQFPAEGA